jgi:glycine/D-amino acid oxidase-like deaminating enzyme
MVTSDYLRDARIVVIGAGVIGSALAYRLAQAGAEVEVVEQALPGSGTSGATFAYLNGTDKPPRDYHRMSLLGIRDQEDLADELGGDWVHVHGSLHWEETGTGRAAELSRVMRRLLEWGARADQLTPDEVTTRLEPDLAIPADRVSAVWYVERAGWLDPMALVAACLDAATTRYRARASRAAVVALPRAGEMIRAVAVDDGRELEADVVLNAAGPDAGAIAALAGTALPLERTPGLLVVSPPVPHRLHRVIYAPEVHLRPDGGSRVMVQWEPLDTDALDGATPSPDHPRVREAMERAAEVLPALRGVPAEAVRLGVRPMPRDGLPLVGFDPVVGNLYHVVTHSGITLAARLARLVTEELTGGDTAPLDPYRPGRRMAGTAAGAAD